MQKLSVVLPDDLALYVEDELQNGRYRDASALVTEGLRRLQQADSAEMTKFDQLKRAVDEGLIDHRNGRYSAKGIQEIADSVLGEKPIAP